MIKRIRYNDPLLCEFLWKQFRPLKIRLLILSTTSKSRTSCTSNYFIWMQHILPNNSNIPKTIPEVSHSQVYSRNAYIRHYWGITATLSVRVPLGQETDLTCCLNTRMVQSLREYAKTWTCMSKQWLHLPTNYIKYRIVRSLKDSLKTWTCMKRVDSIYCQTAPGCCLIKLAVEFSVSWMFTAWTPCTSLFFFRCLTR